MKHIYEYNSQYYIGESEKDCTEEYESDNGKGFEEPVWSQENDEHQFHIMFPSLGNGHLDKGDIKIPEECAKYKLHEDDWYDIFQWSVYAKCKNWAEVNPIGLLCKELD